jgi:hypothetical protein
MLYIYFLVIYILLKIYVIGGIVDRSVKKRCSLLKAHEEQVRTMRLPIQEYICKRKTHILNIDQALQVICKYLETKVKF